MGAQATKKNRKKQGNGCAAYRWRGFRDRDSVRFDYECTQHFWLLQATVIQIFYSRSISCFYILLNHNKFNAVAPLTKMGKPLLHTTIEICIFTTQRYLPPGLYAAQFKPSYSPRLLSLFCSAITKFNSSVKTPSRILLNNLVRHLAFHKSN